MKPGPKQLLRWCELLVTGSRSALLAGGRERARLEAIENPKASLLELDVYGGRETTHVPKGSLAVYVGPEMRRFVIPTNYLCSPDFRVLLERVADEFGFEQKGGLRIPCEEEVFEDLIRGLNKSSKKVRR